ncbi:MAG TPA: site-specific DNA-methyltransferase [Bacteroidales bacterium]|nr:site-specific DNA-methyltransferase [Bacteroidales bacterium]HRT00086.1 site-specific DNA-methyltransferase [Bacteroidales bacterium]
MDKQDFIKAGFTVVGTENNENKLLRFLKEHYPSVIKDNEINLQELKAILGLPVDEKVNGYGLNFVGRNFARAKYAQKTEKELRLNNTLSKNIDTTENLVLKGDNLDCLKILKNHYSGKIKCIYIDPPYNTDSDEFVYPDRFDKEELEILGLANLSESDFARMEFSFKTKKSHNGWLAFMYPRLLLARDLLSKDGVIFISIDDNEQANLKLLCDDVFGEENFCGQIVWQTATDNNPTQIATEHEYVIVYAKSKDNQDFWESSSEKGQLIQSKYEELKELYGDKIESIQTELRKWIRKQTNGDDLSGVAHYSYVDEKGVFYPGNSANTKPGGYTYDIIHPITKKVCAKPEYGYRWKFETFKAADDNGDVLWGETEKTIPKIKKRLDTVTEKLKSYYYEDNRGTTAELKNLFDGKVVFNNPKSINFLVHILKFVTNLDGIVLDFFAGSGSTGHAVMQLNAKDGGNRKFILCQIDEPIKEDKPAYKFCIDNNLPPVISSITIERLKRAGEKIAKEIESENGKAGMFEENKKQVPDIGFKVFDCVDAPKLNVDDNGQIQFPEINTDALSRIYNMIFTVGLDEPTQVPEEVVKDCIYRIGNNYYITNSEKVTSDEYANAIKNGKLFIDGWTASLNGTLLNYKEDVKIVF